MDISRRVLSVTKSSMFPAASSSLPYLYRLRIGSLFYYNETRPPGLVPSNLHQAGWGVPNFPRIFAPGGRSQKWSRSKRNRWVAP
jgi:hypothetical protein